MIFLVINITIIIVLICFSIMMPRKNSEAQIEMLSRFFILGVLQCISVILLFLMQNFIILDNLAERLYLFTIVLLFIFIFSYCISFPNNEISLSLKIILLIVIFFAVYFCFFMPKIEDASAGEGSKLFLTSFTSFLSQYRFLNCFYMLILPLVSITILVIRGFFAKNKILRFQMILSAIVLLSAFFLFFILIFISNFKPLLNFLYPIVTVYIIFALYAVILINHVLSIKKMLILLKDFFINYIPFSIFATLIFTFCFFHLSSNFYLFALIGSVGLFALFVLQAIFREKRKVVNNHNLSDYSFALNSFFSKIDYSSGWDNVVKSVSDVLIQDFDASSIEFFVGSKESELSIVYSTRNFTNKIIDTDNHMFTTLFDSDIFILSRSLLKTMRKLSDVRQDLDDLFTECDSEAMVFLREDRRVLGIISLGQKKRSKEYSDFDLDMLKYLYPHFFVFNYFIKNIMKQSLIGTIDREIEFSDQIIRSIQENMDKISQPTLDIGYISLSARNLGGDFVDFIRLTESRHMFILGDVSGKGLNASMSMVILKSLMRTFLSETTDFKGLIEKVNTFIKFNLPRGTFFAGVFMIIDFHDNMLYYVNCGVPGIFLYTEAYNNVIEIQGDGKVLGFVKNVASLLKVRKIKLSPGDIIVTCTDGLTDSVSLRGELYGKRRIQNILLENRSYSADKITQFIYDDLLGFTTKGIQDDVSVVTLRILGDKI